MAENTAIAWTDHTFNPWIGCARVSPGCANCYAETLDKRYGGTAWETHGQRRVTGPDTGASPSSGTATRCAPAPAPACSAPAWATSSRTTPTSPNPGPGSGTHRADPGPDMAAAHQTAREHHRHGAVGRHLARPRVGRHLRGRPAPRRRAHPPPRQGAHRGPVPSCEPLLAPVDLDLTGVSWAIIGGESGPGHRPMDLGWLASIVDQCRAAGVAVFVKQDAGLWSGRQGRIPDECGCTSSRRWPSCRREPSGDRRRLRNRPPPTGHRPAGGDLLARRPLPPGKRGRHAPATPRTPSRMSHRTRPGDLREWRQPGTRGTTRPGRRRRGRHRRRPRRRGRPLRRVRHPAAVPGRRLTTRRARPRHGADAAPTCPPQSRTQKRHATYEQAVGRAQADHEAQTGATP